MEATALWDFEATQTDEMSFKKGNKLCIMSNEDGGWYRAIMGMQTGFIPASYIRMEPHDWYREPMTRAEAEKFILQKTSSGSFSFVDGAFIIRKSESDRNGFALSVKHEDTVQHFKILTDSNNKFYIWPTAVFPSINQLVEKYRAENVSGDPRKIIYLRDIKQELYEAMYDFSPTNQEEIELKKGDIIRLIAKSDPNWWEGEVRGKTGFFPKNYVKEYK
ncbi:unnamed protein product [Lymnaea stagnalis]|uniref:Uncharacterized protein n=1 Tax=Lymnaea stagnalis TaxID=6523 RepID=A0AAV2IEY0_LYMST